MRCALTPNPSLNRTGRAEVRGTFSQLGPRRPASAGRLARMLGDLPTGAGPAVECRYESSHPRPVRACRGVGARRSRRTGGSPSREPRRIRSTGRLAQPTSHVNPSVAQLSCTGRQPSHRFGRCYSLAMLRLALQSDSVQLAELRWLSRQADEQGAESLEEFTPRFTAWLVTALGSSQWLAAVASDGAVLVGCMFLQRIATVPVPGGTLPRQWGYITHAYVRPPYRRQGLGSSMLGLLIDQASHLKLHELHVWPSVEAVSLYTRAGFRSPEEVKVTVPPDAPSYVLPLKQVGPPTSQEVA